MYKSNLTFLKKQKTNNRNSLTKKLFMFKEKIIFTTRKMIMTIYHALFLYNVGNWTIFKQFSKIIFK